MMLAIKLVVIQEGRMRFVGRVVAALIMGSLLSTSVFCEEPIKSGSTTPEAAPGSSATSAEYLAPAIPAYAWQANDKQTKTKAASSNNSEITPAIDVFAGFSFVRFNPNVGGAKEHFN